MIEPKCYHACALDKQYLYITGGYSLLKRKHGEMIAVSSTDRLNLIDRQWKSCANMVRCRAAHALVSHKGYLYAFGGRNSQGRILSSVEMYDPHHDLWTEITSLPHPTMGLSATCIMDSVWLIGGITDHPSKDPAECLLSNVFSFIPSINKWCEEMTLPYACAFSSCISNDYALWLIGGCTTSRSSKEENTMISCPSVLQLSLSEKPKWKPVASLLYPRHALTAVLYDEYIYIFGGIESDCNCTSDKVEVINTIGNISTISGKMPVSIAGCTSVLIVAERDDYRYADEASDEFSTYSEKTNLKSDIENYYSDGSSKVSSMLEDIYNINKDSYLPSTSASKELYVESYKKTFDKQPAKSKTLVMQENFAGVITNQENFKKKNASNSEVDKQAENEKNVRYRTSMEIFLDIGEIDPYAAKNEPSRASKWLDYLQKLSLSDEKLHKEVFQSKDPKLDVKTEICSTRVGRNLKSTEVKYFKKGSNLDILTSSCMQSSVPSQHKSFMYVKSDVDEQPTDINLEKKLNDKKETSEDSIVPDTTDLKLDNLHDDASGETKIVINEDSFPIILLIGGEYSRRPIESRFILTYYCNEDNWDRPGYMLPEYRTYHSAVFLNNKIYIIGGFRSENSKFIENITNKTIYYDIDDKVWHDGADINHPRALHSTVVLKDKIYILGGRSQSGQMISSIEVYDESSNIWKECGQLPYPISGAATFSLCDSIYLYGGIADEEEDEIISSNIVIFDAKQNNCIIGFQLPIPLAFCGIANDLNSVWLFGGLTVEGNDLVSSKDVFKSDIFSKTWTKVAELSTPRLASVTILIEEKVYVIGGHSSQEKQETLTCELVELTSNTVSLLKSLPIGVSGKAGVIIS